MWLSVALAGVSYSHTTSLETKTHSAVMASSWLRSFLLCCLLIGPEIVLGFNNKIPDSPPVNQTSSPVRHGTRSKARKVTPAPTKPSARIFSTSTKPTVAHFTTEDLKEKIEPNLEKWLRGKGERDEPSKSGKK